MISAIKYLFTKMIDLSIFNQAAYYELCSWLWCIKPLSTIYQLYRGTSYICGGNRSTLRKPLTRRKSLTNFIT
jgi:hypothetical protein